MNHQRDTQPPDTAAPISISRLPDGRLMISSNDTHALDQLEELMGQLAPPGRIDYKIFRLKYAWAYGVAMNLKEIFREDDKERRNPFFWWDNNPGREDSDKGQRLSKRRPLKIISDADTNSVLVQGADPGQLRKIQEIIEFLRPAPIRPMPSQCARRRPSACDLPKQKWWRIRSRTCIANLLSANDKALQNGQQPQRPSRNYTFVFRRQQQWRLRTTSPHVQRPAVDRHRRRSPTR